MGEGLEAGGYSNVARFPGDKAEWEKAGSPVESGAAARKSRPLTAWARLAGTSGPPSVGRKLGAFDVKM